MSTLEKNGLVNIPGNRIVSSPLHLGQYIETYAYVMGLGAGMSVCIANQQKYLRDKAELSDMVERAHNGDKGISRNIKTYANMVTRVKKLSHKQTQIKVINAWFNLFIKPDWQEAKTSRNNLDHHTLVESLTLRKGMCDEVARLKLCAMEMIGFSTNDIRWLGLRSVQGEKGHAVALTQLSEKSWILNNDHFPATSRQMRSIADRNNLYAQASRILRDSTFFVGTTFAASPRFVPIYSFNSLQRATISRNSSLPEGWSVARNDRMQLESWELALPEVQKILRSACPQNYRPAPPCTTRNPQKIRTHFRNRRGPARNIYT